MTSPSEVKRHVDDAFGADPRLAVVAVRRLLDDDLPVLEARAVRFARAEGYTWSRLGRLLGRSRQAVHQRFGAIDGTPQPPIRRRLHPDERFMVLWNESLADGRRRREFDELGPRDAVPW